MKRFAITTMALLVTLALAATAFAEPRGFTENPGGPSTSVLSNQVELYHYIPSGECYDAWTGGVKLRNAVSPAGGGAAGTITVPALVAVGQANAQLIWVILDDVVPPATETFNGFALARIPIGPVTASPCWPQASAFAYRADVTGLVVPGVNTLAGFPDTGVISAGSNTEGATLVIAHATNGVDKELILTVGNDLVPPTASLPLAPVGAAGTGAELVFIGADGQLADDAVFWNGVSLAGTDAWLGLDQGPGVGYWDTMEFGVTIGGPNLAEVVSGGDCVNWVATLLKVKSGGCQTVGTESETWGGVKKLFR